MVTQVKSDPLFRVQLSLVLQGLKLDPSYITQILSISPSRIIEVNVPGSSKKQPTWILRSPADPSNSNIETQWLALHEVLSPKSSLLAGLAKDVNVHFACAVYSGFDTPPIYFPRQMIQFASIINAAIDIDLYFRPVEGQEII